MAEDGWACDKCIATVTAADAYCWNCGESLGKPKGRPAKLESDEECNECGKPTGEYDNFCRHCGVKFEEKRLPPGMISNWEIRIASICALLAGLMVGQQYGIIGGAIAGGVVGGLVGGTFGGIRALRKKV